MQFLHSSSGQPASPVVDTQHMLSFVAAAEEKNFSRAADRLSLTQPTLSRHIQRLEEELDAQLFDRSGHAVELTGVGAAFLEEARRLLDEVEWVRRTVQRAARGEEGRLAIGFTGYAMYGALPRCLRRFRERCPQVAISLHEMRSHEQPYALRRRTISAAFGSAFPEEFASEVVAREEVMLAFPARHPLAAAPEVALADLADESFVLVDRAFEPALFDDLVALCRQAGFGPRIAQRANRVGAALGMAAAGLGVAFAPASLRNRPGAQDVRFVPFAGPSPRLALRMAWLADDPDPVLRRLVEAARSVSSAAPALSSVT